MSDVDELRQAAGDLLHEWIDGDYLIAAGRGLTNEGHDVPLRQARVSEVVWWAVDALWPLLDRLAEVEAQLERTEQQIHEPGGFIDEVVDLTERLSAAKAAISDVRSDPLLGRVAGRLDVALRDALDGPQEATGGDLRPSEPQDDHPCYSDALRWAADVAHSEARWQWERDLRRITGAQIVAQRAEVLEACYREAADRHDQQASGSESDHGDRREGEGLA